MRNRPGESVLSMDLHGQTAYQARVAIDAALRRASPATYRLRLIHGHHLGTVIREMIPRAYAAHPRVLRIDPVSEGITELILREL